MISILTENDVWAYVCGHGDGISYIIKTTMEGAALWKTYEEAYLMKENLFPNSTQTIRIREMSRPDDVLSVSRAQMLQIEQEKNVLTKKKEQ